MSQCGSELYFSTRSPHLLPFQRFEADFGNLGPSQLPRLDFLEELPDDSVRQLMVSIRLRRRQMGGLQSAKIILDRSLTSLRGSPVVARW